MKRVLSIFCQFFTFFSFFSFLAAIETMRYAGQTGKYLFRGLFAFPFRNVVQAAQCRLHFFDGNKSPTGKNVEL